jgi:hypothetical protein
LILIQIKELPRQDFLSLSREQSPIGGVLVKFVLFVLSVVAATTVLNNPTKAQNYPWCALYAKNGGQNCGFTTFQQCQAALSGAADFCQPNTQYVPPPGPHPSTRVRRYPY